MPRTQPRPRRRTDGNVPTFRIKFRSSRFQTAARGAGQCPPFDSTDPRRPVLPQNALSWGHANEAICPRALKITLASSSCAKWFLYDCLLSYGSGGLGFLHHGEVCPPAQPFLCRAGPGVAQGGSLCPKDRAGQDAAGGAPALTLPGAEAIAPVLQVAQS